MNKYRFIFLILSFFVSEVVVAEISTDVNQFKCSEHKWLCAPSQYISGTMVKQVIDSAPEQSSNKTEITAKPVTNSADREALNIAERGSIVYVRVPRTTGEHELTLRDGSTITGKHLDAWDTLPDTALKYSGFAAPGQLVYRDTSGVERILYDCVIDNSPCVPLDPSR